MVNYQTRQAIASQVANEIQFARTYKQAKTSLWKINEDLYYGRKLPTKETSRSNVDLSRMQEFVHTLLSKIDTPLLFKFAKRKNSQLKRVGYLNALRVADQDKDWWDIKDLVGKKQGTIYGRAIYSYYADSYEGYRAHLDNVDVYDFLIDPSAGGIDIERARYLGDYGVVMTRQELEAGVKSGAFLRTETTRLLEGTGNATDETQEVTNTNNRTQAQNVATTTKEISDPDKYKFWRWGTTYKGQRYYCLYSDLGGTAIRIDPIEDVFESGLWWYWTYAVFPDLTEFWTPSYCDYVREIFMAQNVTINQMLDNSEEINKPQKVIDVSAIKNLAELKYQRGGNNIKMTGGGDANRAIQVLRPPSIETPLKVFDILESIQEKSSGVNANAKGTSDEDKVGIYEGNQANTADRFGLLNKSYAFGYKRFAKLWEYGVREHLTKKTAVDILGPDGVDIEEISRRDIFRKNESFTLLVESSNAELALSEVEKRTKIAFLNAEIMNPGVNQKKSFEIKASIAGFDEETIRQLMDIEDFGTFSVMSEADRDIERILDGETIRPNQIANTAYKQRFVDYLQDQAEKIRPEQVQNLMTYVESLDQIIVKNMMRQAQEIALRQQLQQIKSGVPSNAPQGPARPTGPSGEVAPVAQPLPQTLDVLQTNQ